MTRPRIRLLIGDTVALGPGKAALLEAIAETGSIASAARRMRMSYRRAWSLVQAMNADFTKPLVERAAGGRGGGGAVVTPLGHDAIERYRTMEARASAAVESDLDGFTALLKPQVSNPDTDG
ncbi:MAG: LysR family transcriptional regulator [Alphaproteobacteria bacterium]|nr:LysR family transcriptional regulator [Alphaproteobacteria bacterium]